MRIEDPDRLRQLFTCTHGRDIAADVFRRAARAGCVLEGHFRLQGGLHSPNFVRFSLLGRELADADAVATHLQKLAGDFLDDTTLLCASNGGEWLGAALERVTSLPLAVAEIDARRRPTTTLRRGEVRGRVVLVADVVTSGGSLARLVELAQKHGAEPVAAFAFATLDERAFRAWVSDHHLRGEVLLSARWVTESPSACSLCRRNQPLIAAIELN